MKTKLIYLFTLAAFVFASCSEKDLYDETRTEKEVSDLDVPTNFDWSMTRTIDCNLTTTVATDVVILTDKDNLESVVAEYTVAPEEGSLPLIVPTHLSKLYVKVGEEISEVDVTEGVLNLNITKPASKVMTASASTYSFGDVYFPEKCTPATVMFEDNFPVQGDYDFNDFVINYRYKANLTWLLIWQLNTMEIEVTVKALGGTFEYAPYLRILGTSKVKTVKNATLVSQGKDGIILAIDDYSQRPDGARFLNTDPAEEKGVTKTITIELDFRVLDFQLPSYKDLQLDFFIKGTGHLGNTYEIHERGFEAIDAACYPTGGFTLGSTPYTTDKNLVWGFTIPENVDHAIEEANFLDAYPQFKEWAESGGTKNKQWYKNGVSGYLFQ